MILELISFGFKLKNTPESNYLIDVRFLNNPFYVDELRDLTGLDKEVINFLQEDVKVNEFLKKLFEWTEYILNANKFSDKEKIIIAIGCTGGQHRSPYITECLAKYLAARNLTASEIFVNHRELKKYNILREKTKENVS